MVNFMRIEHLHKHAMLCYEFPSRLGLPNLSTTPCAHALLALQKLAGQAHQPSRSTGTTHTTALAGHVHLESHLRRRGDGGLLITGLNTVSI